MARLNIRYDRGVGPARHNVCVVRDLRGEREEREGKVYFGDKSTTNEGSSGLGPQTFVILWFLHEWSTSIIRHCDVSNNNANN